MLVKPCRAEAKTLAERGSNWACAALDAAHESAAALRRRAMRALRRVRGLVGVAARDEEGQGTTEYALIVGVLVVVAIAALVTLRDQLQTLWGSITTAMGTL